MYLKIFLQIYFFLKMFDHTKMEYRNLGNSGLLVSAFSYGNWALADGNYEQVLEVFKLCLKNGINHFDTAEIYQLGKGEEVFGQVFKDIGEKREHLVIATKVWLGPQPFINSDGGTSRKHIRQAVKGSLKRLQMDYVDIIYAHGYDQNTPIEETCRAFHEVIEEGEAFYWGTSNWDVDQIFKAFQVCEKLNLHKPICGQNQYNMIHRKQVEYEYERLFEKYRYGLVAFSPLLGGILTGKYINEKPKGSRFDQGVKTGGTSTEGVKARLLHDVDLEQMNGPLLQVQKIAEEELGCKLAHLALAWVAKFKHTSSCIIGARNIKQMEDNLKALEVLPKLTPEIETKINKIMGTNPDPKINFRSWTPFPSLRL